MRGELEPRRESEDARLVALLPLEQLLELLPPHLLHLVRDGHRPEVLLVEGVVAEVLVGDLARLADLPERVALLVPQDGALGVVPVLPAVLGVDRDLLGRRGKVVLEEEERRGDDAREVLGEGRLAAARRARDAGHDDARCHAG